METDRELLELAAKACMYEIVGWRGDIPLVIRPSSMRKVLWNPLVDDAEAFRLIAKLHLTVTLDDDVTDVYNSRMDGVCEDHNGNRYAATRRAIVRAAAEIGKGMK